MAVCTGEYCCIIFPLSSMELQQLLQLEAILYALKRQDNFQSFPFDLSTILYMCSQTILKQINKVWNLPSSGLRPFVGVFHSWFWICLGLSLRNYGKSSPSASLTLHNVVRVWKSLFSFFNPDLMQRFGGALVLLKALWYAARPRKAQ